MSFQKRLAANEFAVLGNTHTPTGINISRIITDAKRLKGRIDAVVPDMDNGIMRMSALAGGLFQPLKKIVRVFSSRHWVGNTNFRGFLILQICKT
ncbi:MAG: hypothetical protein COA36_12125 [Desulfotalea sp.]|nr:MAG: hypothetical protein COA36_12125 [Desulfotalea sp.]